MADALDEIRALNQPRGPRCTIGVFFEQHPDLADTVVDALEDPSIQRRSICVWLRKAKGVSISYDALRRHSRGDCGCE